MDYLKELPDELDACIAQRDFENTVELLFDGSFSSWFDFLTVSNVFRKILGRENLQECPDAAFVRDLREKLDQKQQQLVDVLCKELKISSDKNLQGGPKAARKAMTLLIKLGKSSQVKKFSFFKLFYKFLSFFDEILPSSDLIISVS